MVPVPPPPEELPLPCEEPPVPPPATPVPVDLDGVGREVLTLGPLLGAGWLGAGTSVTGGAGATVLGAGSTAAALGSEPVLPLGSV